LPGEQPFDLHEVGAQALEEAGHGPNDVSYNCLLNASVSSGSGNFHDAWETIAVMEKTGVAVDHYTIPIMMKVRNHKDVSLASQLLDRACLDVCADEISMLPVQHKGIWAAQWKETSNV